MREEFERLTLPFRRELLVYCYRMLGSIDDAEDLVQEIYLRAWRSYDAFQGRSSLRTWLYRIATNACLNALEHTSRRVLPSGLAGPSDTPRGPLSPAQPEVTWLQPLPGPDAGAADPAALVESRSSLRLAFVAALQHLPARQRAVLILRDVLVWRAAEVADLLDTTTAAIKSTLQRARAQIAQAAPSEDRVMEPGDPEEKAVVDRYMAAFQNADVTALAQLLRDDAMLEMPPLPAWFAGRESVAQFVSTRIFGGPGRDLMAPTTANAQPAAAAYRLGADGVHHAHALHVLTTTGGFIARIDAFLDPRLFTAFGLAPVLETTASAAHARGDA